MKAKRLTILSALGSALVTRVPIDRCRSPSSHFRTPLHMLATAILMRKSPSCFASIRSHSSKSGASHMVFVFTYLSCRIKNVILDFPREASRHVSICSLTTYVWMHVLARFATRDVFIPRKWHTSRAHVCIRTDLYVYMWHPVCVWQTRNESVIYTFTYTRVSNINIEEKKISRRHSSTAGHQRENSTPLSRVSILFISLAFHVQDTRVKYGGWGWTSRALPIRTCTSHNSLVTSTET